MAIPSEPGMCVHRHKTFCRGLTVSWLSASPASTLVSGKEWASVSSTSAGDILCAISLNALNPAIQPLCSGDDKRVFCSFLLTSLAACSVCLPPKPGTVFWAWRCHCQPLLCLGCEPWLLPDAESQPHVSPSSGLISPLGATVPGGLGGWVVLRHLRYLCFWNDVSWLQGIADFCRQV